MRFNEILTQLNEQQSGVVNEDRADDIHTSDNIDDLISGIDKVKIYQNNDRPREAIENLRVVKSKFINTFERRLSRNKLDDFLVPLDSCLEALESGNWDRQVMNQTLDICITFLDIENDRIWREIDSDGHEEGGFGVGDLSETYNEYDDEEDEEDNDEGFFVVISNEEKGVFIGYVTKEDNRWQERRVSGKPPYAWGGPKYMGYLKPRDVMTWIHRDYERHYEVKGPFADEESARDYANNYLSESDDPDQGWKVLPLTNFKFGVMVKFQGDRALIAADNIEMDEEPGQFWFGFTADFDSGKYKIDHLGWRRNTPLTLDMVDEGILDEVIGEILDDVRKTWGATSAELRNEVEGGFGLGDLSETKTRLDPKCWKGWRKQGTKMKGGVRVNNCVKIKK